MNFSCPICQSTQKHILCTEIRDWHDKDTYQIMECTICHLHRTHPFPNDINTANTVNNYAQAPDPLIRFLRNILNTFEIKQILRSTGSKKILDVGAGFGEFSEAAFKMGCDVVAADTFDSRPYCLRSLPKVPYYHFNWQTHSMDHPDEIAGRTVILRHVLEHVSDPYKFLEKFIQAKAEYFYIVVPNYTRIQKEFLKEYDILWGLPQHLWHFDIHALRTLFQHLNCTILKEGYTTIPTVECSAQLYARRNHFPKWLIHILENRFISTLMMSLQIFFPNNVLWLIIKTNTLKVSSHKELNSGEKL